MHQNSENKNCSSCILKQTSKPTKDVHININKVGLDDSAYVAVSGAQAGDDPNIDDEEPPAQPSGDTEPVKLLCNNENLNMKS